MMKIIELSRGYVTKVDDADYDALSAWNWYAVGYDKRVSAVRAAGVNDKGSPVVVSLSRQLFNFPSGLVVAHLDGDALNNQRENLAVCTKAQMLRKSRKRKVTHSRFPGVSWRENRKSWAASYPIGLGFFPTQEEAERAYADFDKRIPETFREQ